MRRGLLVVAGVFVIAAAGCGGGKNAAAPGSVRAALSQVDAAVQADDYARARSGLDSLIASTNAARADGQLSGARANQVLAAAAQLRADLPAPAPSTPATTPDARPSAITPSVQPPQPGPGRLGGGKKGKGAGDNGGGDGQGN